MRAEARLPRRFYRGHPLEQAGSAPASFMTKEEGTESTK